VARIDALAVEPCGDGSRVEAQEVAPLEVRDASFGDEASDVADGDAEVFSDGGDVEQRR
jgi:hypothetical protein